MMDRNRGSVADRYTINFHDSQSHKHPLLSRLPDDTPINHHRGVFSGDLRRYSEFDVPSSSPSMFHLDAEVSRVRQFNERAVSPTGVMEFNLFVGSLNTQATEKEVEDIFLPYGRVEDVYLMRDEKKQSRGCGFVKFFNRDVAMIAIKALNGIYTMKGCQQPLIVRFADPKRRGTEETREAPELGGLVSGPQLQSPGIRPRNLGEAMHAPVSINASHPMGQHGMVPSIGFGSHVAQAQVGVSSTTALSCNLPPRASTSNISQHQLPGQQNMLQPVYKSAPPLSRMLSHQKQTSQASYQSFQQPFSQLQPQPSNPSFTPPQNFQSARLQMTSNTETNTDKTTFCLRPILEIDNLTGPNFLNWERNLIIVLKQERKLYVLDTPLGNRPAYNAPQAVKIAYEKHQYDLVDVTCLMLATMSPDLQKKLVRVEPYDMIHMLQEMFLHQARTERYETTEALQSCKMVKGASLRSVGHPLPQALATDTILGSLSKDHKQFVTNFTKNNLERSIPEMHKSVEKTMNHKHKEVLMVRQGRVQKKLGKNQSNKVVAKSNNKPGINANIDKSRKVVAKSNKKPKPKTKVNKHEDEVCFHCNEVGHWRRNCLKYLEELKKNKANMTSTSASC